MFLILPQVTTVGIIDSAPETNLPTITVAVVSTRPIIRHIVVKPADKPI
jgi:hypothetical protein